MKKILKYCFLLVISFLSFCSTIDGNSTTPNVNENTPKPSCVNNGTCDIVCSYGEGDNVLHIYYDFTPNENTLGLNGFTIYYKGSENIPLGTVQYAHISTLTSLDAGICPIVFVKSSYSSSSDICLDSSQLSTYCKDLSIDMTELNITFSLSEKMEEYGPNFKLKYNDYPLPADLSDVPEDLKTQLCADYSASLTNANDGDNNYLDRLFIQQFGEEFILKSTSSYEHFFTDYWYGYLEMKKNLQAYMINLETNLIEECEKILPNDDAWNEAKEDLENKGQFGGYNDIMNEAHQEAIDNIVDTTDPGYSVNVDTNVGTCQDYIGIVSVEGSPAYYIDYVYDVVKILVTVGLVLLSMFDIVKAITSEKNINSVYTKIAYRLAIVIMVLLLPTLISLVGELFTDKDILCGIR